MPSTQTYQGSELDLFSHATHWKNYWGSLVQHYICGKILEVGAGNGNNTLVLCAESVKQWVSVEPDSVLASQIKEKPIKFAKDFSVISGTIEAVAATDFDCVLYLDVLEHIKEDRLEIEQAVKRLKKGGTLVVLSPSHQWLYSEFDKSIGHYRRYNKQSLRACVPKDLEEVELRYLDSVGLAASLANRLFLKKSYPNARNIQIWDSFMVPLSRWTDVIFSNLMGRSILGVWRKT